MIEEKTFLNLSRITSITLIVVFAATVIVGGLRIYFKLKGG